MTIIPKSSSSIKDDYSYFTQKTLYEENHKNLNRVQNLLEEFERSLKVLYDQGCTDENVTETVKLHANFADRLQDFTRDLREAFDQKTRDDAAARGKENEDREKFWRQAWLRLGLLILGAVLAILLQILFNSWK